MVTSRTGTASHKRFRREVLREGLNRGVLNCPCQGCKHHPGGICNTPLDYTTSRTPNSAEPDHLTPHSLGGTDNPTNGRVICRRCNQARGNRTTDLAVTNPTATPTTTTLIHW